MNRILVAGILALTLALVGCKSDPSTPEHWTKRFEAKSKKERLKAVEELRASKHMSPAMVPVLTKQLSVEKAPEVKGAIARVLGEQKSKESVDALLEAVDFSASETEAKTMNKEIVNALGAIGDPKAIATLKKLLNAKDNYTVIAAIEALAAMKAKDAFDEIYRIASDPAAEPFIVKKAVVALGDLGDPRAVPGLVKLMFFERKDRGISFYMESSFALYQLGQPASDAVLPVLNETDKDLQKWAEQNNVKTIALPLKAAQVLGDLHEPRAEKALVNMLTYKTEFDDVKGLMKMKAADALGRLRSTEGMKAMIPLVMDEEPSVRRELVWSLIRIGGRDALPKLMESASKGFFEARSASMRGVAMLGDERELAFFDKAATEEPKLLDAECKEVEDELPDCKNKPETVTKRQALINGFKPRLEAAKECKVDVACWVKKLDDTNAGVRERAGYEVGRSKQPTMTAELMKHLRETDLDARLAIIQGVDWLVHDSKDAQKVAQGQLSELEKQLADEKGKTDFIKTNEDLRRLRVKVSNGS